ncbi:MAG: hypothetical protein Ct9H300mP23_12120 [Nitrospinota bacterium]|nr:MAG: hypothetical protein Ct9H300mP23_12120 [Nitrospinota bacterium]
MHSEYPRHPYQQAVFDFRIIFASFYAYSSLTHCGNKISGEMISVIRLSQPRRIRPAAAKIIASNPSVSSFFNLVSKLPRRGINLRSGDNSIIETFGANFPFQFLLLLEDLLV